MNEREYLDGFVIDILVLDAVCHVELLHLLLCLLAVVALVLVHAGPVQGLVAPAPPVHCYHPIPAEKNIY